MDQPPAVGAAGEGPARVPALPVHQHPDRLAHIGAVELAGDLVLGIQEAVEPHLLLLPGGGVRHPGRRGAGPGGVNEGEEGVVADLPDEGDRVHGLRLRLPGEADDDVAGEDQVRHGRAGGPDLLQVLLPGVTPVHGLQHPAVPRLDGEVELPGHMGAPGHGLEELVPGVLGVAGHEADQVVPGDLVDLREEVGEIHGGLQVLAVGVDVLAQEGDVLVPLVHQLPDLRQDVPRLPAPLPAPDIGDDAVGAEVVAAVHDGDPGLHRALPDHRHPLGDGAVLLLDGEHPPVLGAHVVEELREPPEGLGAEDQVHVAVGGPDLLGHHLLLGHAAAQADDEVGVLLLGVDQAAQQTVDPVLRVLPDGAGVDDDEPRLHGVAGEGAAHVPEHPHEALAVRHILLAAVGLHPGLGRAAPLAEQLRKLIRKVPLPRHVRGGDHNLCSVQWFLLARPLGAWVSI